MKWGRPERMLWSDETARDALLVGPEKHDGGRRRARAK
jgi:hypothetical protein